MTFGEVNRATAYREPRHAWPGDERVKHVSADVQLIYASTNGDRWLLIARPGDERKVRHEPNQPSGGQTSEMGIDEFLFSSHGPQHDALRAMLATSERAMRGGTAVAYSAAQIRAGRALLGWSQDRLAQEANLESDEITACETSSATPPRFDLMARAASALQRGGVVLFGEGEVTAGGPGVRMGALGTSTGQPLEAAQADANDNQPAADQGRSSATST